MRHRTLFISMLVMLTPLAASALPRLAVMDLTAKSGIKQSQLDVLGDMLATEIRSLGIYEVITKHDIESMLGLEKSKEFLGCDDASCLAEIGGALGVDLVVSGNVGRFGKVYAVNLKLINIRKAKVENSVFRKVKGGEQALLDDFTIAVRALLGVGGAPTSTAGTRPAYTPPPPTYSGPGGARGLTDLGFTSEQIQKIHGSGIRITADAPTLAKRLMARGFTTDELTEFIVRHGLLNHSPRDAELFVLFYSAGLKPKLFPKFLKNSSRVGLTDYYNQQQEGIGLEVGKWVCFGLGLLFGVTGAAYYGLASLEEDTASWDSSGSSTMADTYWMMGHVFMGLGAPLFLVSVVLMIVDSVNIGYVPAGFFKNATKDEIITKTNGRTVRYLERRDDGVQLAITPWASPRGDGSGGLMLGIRF